MKHLFRTVGLPALALAGAFLTTGAMHASAHSLTQALVDAYNRSNLLEQERALLRSSDEDVAVAVSRLRPQISADATVQRSYSEEGANTQTLAETISITATMLLADFGRSQFAIEAAKETVLAGRAGLTRTEQSVLLDAVRAYVEVLRSMRLVSLRENNLRLITQELRAARDRFEVGEVTRTDVAQAEARLAQARGELANAQGDLDIAKELYRANTGVAPGPLKPITRLPSVPSSREAAVSMGLKMNPSVIQAQHTISANEFNVAAAKAAMRPQLTAQASAGHSSTIGNNSSIGLQLNVPIYQGGQLRALERRAKAVLQASRSNLHQVVRQTRQNVADAWSRLAVAQAQVRAADRQIRAAQVAFEGVREEAKLGSRTTLDVLNAEQALLDARTDRVVFQTQAYEAVYTLLAQMGMLTVSELNLPVKRYDPSEYFNAAKRAPVPVTKQGRQLNRILDRYGKN